MCLCLINFDLSLSSCILLLEPSIHVQNWNLPFISLACWSLFVAHPSPQYTERRLFKWKFGQGEEKVHRQLFISTLKCWQIPHCNLKCTERQIFRTPDFLQEGSHNTHVCARYGPLTLTAFLENMWPKTTSSTPDQTFMRLQ